MRFPSQPLSYRHFMCFYLYIWVYRRILIGKLLNTIITQEDYVMVVSLK